MTSLCLALLCTDASYILFNDIHIIPQVLNLPSIVLTFHSILLVLEFSMFMRALVLSNFSYIIR
jgi:hypothetical protein